MANQMPKRSTRLKALTILAVMFTSVLYLQAQDKAPATTVPVRMTVAATPLGDGRRKGLTGSQPHSTIAP